VDDSPRPDDKKFAVPAISTSMISHLDSVVSKAGVAPREDVFSVQPTAIAFGNQHLTFGSTNESAAPTRARLVGELPTPLIPPQASDVEGVVRVRFTVDAQGQPLMSTFTIVTSPDPLLAAAVRRVIPQMRFEPARAGGVDGKPISDVVETSFRFARGSH
jgi:TonB family protein